MPTRPHVPAPTPGPAAGGNTPRAPISGKRLLPIIAPFALIIAIMVVLFSQSIDLLSATRAYVNGENLWSKSQRLAIVHLLRFADNGEESDYQAYRAAIFVPQSDARALQEIESPQFDAARAEDYLRQGRNHPDDVAGMIRLVRRFDHVDDIRRMLAIWREAGAAIAELDAQAQQLHQLIGTGQRAGNALAAPLARIRDLNAQLSAMEDAFADTLGRASRKLQLLLKWIIICTAAALLLLGTLVSRQLVRRRDALEQALRLSEERFNLAVDGSNDGLWDWDAARDRIYCSPRLLELLGRSDREPASTVADFAARIHADDREAARAAFRQHLRRDGLLDIELRYRTGVDQYCWLRLRGKSVRDATGMVVRMAGSATDISSQKLAEAQLFAEKERALVTLESIGDAVLTTDALGRVEYINPLAEMLTGWTASEARGCALGEVYRKFEEGTRTVPPDSLAGILSNSGPARTSANLLLVRRDGGEVPIRESVAAIRERSGVLIGAVLVLHDLRREHEYAMRLVQQSGRDSLTGLINRREFERRLGLAVVGVRGNGREHSMLYLDLDHLGEVNERNGYPAGDELIRQVGLVLPRRLREGDTMARLNDDKFAVLLEHCQADKALPIAESLRVGISEVQLASHLRGFSVSIGVVAIDRNTLTPADALAAAESACRNAKAQGRNRVQAYRRKT